MFWGVGGRGSELRPQPYSIPREPCFPIRTSWSVNNIYVLFYNSLSVEQFLNHSIASVLSVTPAQSGS